MLAEIQRKKLEIIPNSGDIFLFKSCTINNIYPTVEASTRKCLSMLNYDLLESAEQTCCTDPLYYSNLANDIQMTTIMARNFSLIGPLTQNIVTECNGCFSMLFTAKKNLMNPELRKKIEPILSKFGYRLRNDFNIIHVVELFYKILPKILQARQKDLAKIRIAAHYGCHFLREHPEDIITDPQMPDLIESIVQKCGATPVFYTERDCCCGAGITQRHLNPDLSLEVSYQKMKSLSKVTPHLIVTICPFCMSTLENCQLHLEVEKEFELSIPVLHISELIGVVLGFDPKTELYLDSHKINPLPILENFLSI